MFHESPSRNGSQPIAEKNDAGNGALLLGLGVGAALMYFFDPQGGRRALVRDRFVHTARKLQEGRRVVVRDATQRARGWMSEASRTIKGDGEITDDVVLVERVRAMLGRAVSHPHAIEVGAHEGCVTLKGPVLAEEVDNLISAAEKVRGVRSVDNQLQVHPEPGNIPALQGGVTREGDRIEWLQRNWSPTARVIAGAVGAALAAFGFVRGGTRGWALGALGTGLVARAATNLEMSSLLGVGDCRGMEVQKTIHIDAPVERVFEYWANFENFPRWMSHVREVHDRGGDQYHWIVDGPAGVPVEWSSRITNVIENRLMQWCSEPGSMVDHAGSVKFQGEGGGTRVQVSMCYVPIAGAVGHVVAKAFGTDPKSEMDADLMRLKTLIETGREPHDAARAQRGADLPSAAPGMH